MPELEQVGGLLESGAGLKVHLRLSKRIMDEWDDVAPDPWKQGAEPLVVLGGELIVRASSAHGVRLLRYAVGGLLEALHRRFGTETITEVRVVAPSGRGTSQSP